MAGLLSLPVSRSLSLSSLPPFPPPMSPPPPLFLFVSPFPPCLPLPPFSPSLSCVLSPRPPLLILLLVSGSLSLYLSPSFLLLPLSPSESHRTSCFLAPLGGVICCLGLGLDGHSGQISRFGDFGGGFPPGSGFVACLSSYNWTLPIAGASKDCRLVQYLLAFHNTLPPFVFFL